MLTLTGQYILDEHNQPIEEPDLLRWAAWMETHRTVKRDDVGGYLVSTVFLGIDHAFGYGPPILWETMVFQKRKDGVVMWGGTHHDFQGRYRSLEDALAGHAEVVAMLRGSLS